MISVTVPFLEKFACVVAGKVIGLSRPRPTYTDESSSRQSHPSRPVLSSARPNAAPRSTADHLAAAVQQGLLT